MYFKNLLAPIVGLSVADVVSAVKIGDKSPHRSALCLLRSQGSV